MCSPAVSGAQTYGELCMAAKNEEKRLAELKRRQEYRRGEPLRQPQWDNRPSTAPYNKQRTIPNVSDARPPRRCFNCQEVGHLIADCKALKAESTGGKDWKDFRKPPPKAKAVQSTQIEEETDDPMSFLYSSESEDTINPVQVKDEGSHAKYVKVDVQGVPTYGIVDSGANITILGGAMFKKVTAAGRLRKKDFPNQTKPPTPMTRSHSGWIDRSTSPSHSAIRA